MIHDDTDLWWHLVLVNSLRTKQRRKARMLKRTQMLAMEEGYSKEGRGGGGSEQVGQFQISLQDELLDPISLN